ncbi:murein hydrolase activator EnvC family protein [Desulfosporosinus sp. SYSU MS00001]|uniref:murein hydrolase activator EnvC family protein n=1 Tax=Desulfosporosinus sp. SYSU MS00001 TaxID=3416284 RepID=UPI003CF97C5B
MSWILVWSCSLLVGVAILCFGYFNNSIKHFQQREPLQIEHATQATAKQEILSTQHHLQTDPASESQAQKEKVLSKATLTSKDFPSPVQGNILRGVGNCYIEAIESYMFHPGEDFSEPEGAVIRATHQGKVVFAGHDPLLGEKVVLDCGQGWIVTYGCLENLWVKTGQNVEKQGLLGQVGFNPGAEGINGQPQLHYEVWHGNTIPNIDTGGSTT